MKIGLVHAAVNAVQPMVDAFSFINPDVQVINFINENLLVKANELGRINDALVRTFTGAVFSVAEMDVDGIVVCCSMYCPYVPLLAPLFSIPILAIDKPMLDYAAAHGRNIGIIATVPGAAPVTQAQIENLALKSGRSITFQVRIVPDAFLALKAGDRKTHNQLIADAGEILEKEGCDTIVLCQGTMAAAAENMSSLKAKVLTSPAEAVKAILALCGKGESD